ncbi:hypothetical protein ABL78_3687 [Leptomonas seymouri]|uniref:RRM domain-containing protein n=1 Tax=Leptomonas seymouri TaxID=5684 RepID=A0A0N0P6I9_LEPSE|nr:hypothetical protein ABL78_3687 [Leptomonas seymouri]|eukprot:KPI87217.1 hypothetical protein ABL78_3687 [Leptomonas seymouri]
MASFSPLDSYKARSRGVTPTGIVIDKSCRVYVTQIPLERIERDGANAMKAEFEVYGPLESFKMFTDRSGRFVGSALCTYRNPADASMAVYCMDGVEVDSSTLHVEPAKEHGVVLLSGSSSKSHNNRDHSRGFLRDTRWQSGRAGRGGGVRWLNAGRAGGSEDASAHRSYGTDASTAEHPLGGVENEEAEGPLSGNDLGASASKEEGKWSHDKYELIAEGKDMDEVLGIRRPTRGGARGRGGGMAGRRHNDWVSVAFEEYIRERDLTEENKSLMPPLSYTTSLVETPTTAASAQVSAASNVEAMGELAFGVDESTAPVAGKELGALPGEAKVEE